MSCNEAGQHRLSIELAAWALVIPFSRLLTYWIFTGSL